MWRIVRSALVIVAVMELALWIVRPTVDYAYVPYWPHMSHFRRSDILPMELRPNGTFRLNMPEFDITVRTNDLGLRGGPIDFSRPRIVCLGDSFTFGFGVEDQETWCAMLERMFGGKYSFVNASFAAGYAPDTYAVWLRHYAPRIRPAAVIVQISEFQYGIVDEHEWFFDEAARRQGDPVPRRIDRPGFVVTADGAWIRKSFAARLPRVVRQLLKASYTVAILRDRLTHDATAQSAVPQNAARSLVAVPPPGRKFGEALDMLFHEAGDRIIGIYVVAFRSARSAGAGERIVRDVARRRGVPVFSNEGDFEAPDYFHLDPHWNVAGQGKAARFLQRELTARGY
jgi:hypothetical protein